MNIWNVYRIFQEKNSMLETRIERQNQKSKKIRGGPSLLRKKLEVTSAPEPFV